jgi:tetratricopeptide (TPR) repeat protein
MEHDSEYGGSYLQLGFLYFVKSNLDEAKKNFEKAISLDSDLAEAYDYLGLVYYQQGDVKKAYSNIEKAFQLDSSDPKIFEDFKMISEAIIDSSGNISGDSAGSVPDVASSSEKAVELNGSTSHSDGVMSQNRDNKSSQYYELYQQGASALKQNPPELEKAVSILKQITDNFPEFEEINEVRYLLARSYQSLGRTNQAIDLYKSLALKGYKEGECYFRIAGVYEKEKMFKEAYGILKILKNKKPDFLKQFPQKGSWIFKHYWLNYFRANFNFVTILMGGVLLFLLIVILLFFMPRILKSRTAVRAGEAKKNKDWVNTVKYYNKLIDYGLNSNDLLEARLSLVKAYYELKNYKKALSNAKHLLKADPDNKFCYDIVGKCYIEQKSVSDEAMNVYRKIIKYDFNNRALLSLMASFYIKKSNSQSGRRMIMKEISEAETFDILKRAYKYDPENKDLISLLAEIYFDLKDTDIEAVKIYELKSETEPENLKIRKFLARVYLDKGMYEKCIDLSKELLHLDIENMVLHQIFKDAHLKHGKSEKLIEEYEEFAKLYSSNIKFQDIYSRITSEVSGSVIKEVKKPVSSDIYDVFKKAGVHLRSKEYDKAITLYKQCIRDKRLRKKSSINLVVCYIRKGAVNLAYQLFSKINIDNDMTNDHVKSLCYDFGRYYEEKGEYPKALYMYDKICKADIGYKDVFDRFEELYRFAGNRQESENV